LGQRPLAGGIDQHLERLSTAHAGQRLRHLRQAHGRGDQRRGIDLSGGQQGDRAADQRRRVVEGPEQAQLLVVEPPGVDADAGPRGAAAEEDDGAPPVDRPDGLLPRLGPPAAPRTSPTGSGLAATSTQAAKPSPRATSRRGPAFPATTTRAPACRASRPRRRPRGPWPRTATASPGSTAASSTAWRQQATGSAKATRAAGTPGGTVTRLRATSRAGSAMYSA